MTIDVEIKRCMTKLGLPLISELRKESLEDREVRCPQQLGKGKLQSKNLKSIKELERKRKGYGL